MKAYGYAHNMLNTTKLNTILLNTMEKVIRMTMKKATMILMISSVSAGLTSYFLWEMSIHVSAHIPFLRRRENVVAILLIVVYSVLISLFLSKSIPQENVHFRRHAYLSFMPLNFSKNKRLFLSFKFFITSIMFTSITFYIILFMQIMKMDWSDW